jgi:protein SCO1/2
MKRLAMAALCLVTVAGCAGSGEDEPVVTIVTPTNSSEFLGTELGKELPKPDVTLTDTKGKPFNIAKDTKGRVTALYVGYTHCPDVCPTTMADLSVAMSKLPEEITDEVDVVFVTTDPNRDTSKVIGKWLNSFSWDGITGLTGPFQDVKETADSVGIFIDEPVKNPDGTYTVEHGAQVILFGKDDTSNLIFTSGFQPEEVAHDLQRLVQQ